MTCDELSKACQKVGRFLHDFALVEQEINERIADILKLEGDAALFVVHNVEFRRKLEILHGIALETAPPGEKKKINELFSAINNQNDDRNIMAHCPFVPAKDGAVQFKRITAKKGKVNIVDPLWTAQKFEQSKKLKEIQAKLAELRPRLTSKISGRLSKEFIRLILTPASTSTWQWNAPRG